jgi:hypothetical protein
MGYYAKLIKGKTYDVLGQRFTSDKDKEVDKKTYDYLENNPQFEVREGEVNTGNNQDEAPDGKYTKSSLKKLNKEQQDAIIHDLSGDKIEETKNEDERISLILALQEG